jgi:lysophospholipase L1-like esterase
MKSIKRLVLPLFVFARIAGILHAAEVAVENSRPTVFLIGDSTVNNSGRGQRGWGNAIATHFDTNRIAVVNRARGGRSSRTYFTEGLWSNVQAELKPGDFVLMQFGHNDGAALTDPRNRASVKGIGDESQTVTNQTTGVVEEVHSYGWYLRQYVAGAKAKGATPIVLSPIPRNSWANGVVRRASKDYGKWAAEIAQAEGVPFVDLNEIVARRYEQTGQEKVATEFFGATDHTHTTAAGAELNARCVVEGIRELRESALAGFLLPTTSD